MRRLTPPSSEPPFDGRRDRKRYVIVVFSALSALVVMTVTGIVLLTTQYRSIGVLAFLNLNILVILALLMVITRNLVKIFLQRNTRFRSKLVAAFVATSLVPVAVLCFLGFGIVSEGMNRLFSPQLETVITGAKGIVDLFIEEERQRLASSAAIVRDELDSAGALASVEQARPILERETRVLQLDAIQIILADEQEWLAVRSSKSPAAAMAELPKALLAGVRSSGEAAFDLADSRKGSSLVAAVPLLIDSKSPYSEQNLRGFVVCRRVLSSSLHGMFTDISEAHREYLRSVMGKGQLKWIYGGVFVTIGLVLIFFALWFGTNLAKEIAGPVQTLAEATESVAAGNLNVHVSLKADTEFKQLIDAFNAMTSQLRDNKGAIEEAQAELMRKNQQLSGSKLYIQTLLQNIPTGVISVDPYRRVALMNRKAGELLGVDPESVLLLPVDDVFRMQPLDRLNHWTRQLQGNGPASMERQLTVQQGGEVLELDVSLIRFKDPVSGAEGTLIVLEDLSALLKAQRAAAWQEVARRIAHEIKNPLTPISISAQQMQRKCRAGEMNSDFLDKSTKIILEGIDEIQTLVNEFSGFARMPQAHLQPGDLQEVIRSTLALYAVPFPHITFETHFQGILPELNLDAEQMRRALRNIIDNAVAAMDEQGTIVVTTEYEPLFQIARVTIADHGSGIKPEDKEKLFMPYFSTKGPKGTGLGLTIVNKIISDHNGYIRIKDNQPQGTKVIIELPTGYNVTLARK